MSSTNSSTNSEDLWSGFTTEYLQSLTFTVHALEKLCGTGT